MRGKRTNLILGVLNIFTALLLCIYVWTNGTLENITRHQKITMSGLTYGVYILTAIVVLINIIMAVANLRKGHKFIYYILSVVSLITIWHLSYVYPVILAVSGIILISASKKSNYIERESFVITTIAVILIAVSTIVSASVLNYKVIAKYIKNRESVSLTSYDKDFFKYIQPIEENSVYINVEINGKYGYIDKFGQTKIDFKYDYATPFYKIEAFDKQFEVAGVSKGTITEIIMKNERKVMSFNSEYLNNDPEEKIKELKNVLKTQMGQKNVKLEVDNMVNGFIKKEIYKYTYGKTERRYKFNDKYDVLIQISQIDDSAKYYLVSKLDETKEAEKEKDKDKDKDKETKTNKNKDKTREEKIQLDAEKLIYDEDYIYVFPGGELPYYSPNLKNRIQGWFDANGKRYKLTKKVQILAIEENKIAIKVYNKSKDKNTAYFISKNNENTKPISQTFKEIIPDGNNYIVKSMNDKWTVVDKDLNRKLTAEFDIFNAELLSQGIYIFANLNGEIEYNDEGYPLIQYTLIKNNTFEIMGERIQNIFDLNIKQSKEEKEYSEYLERLKSSKYENLAEQYYKED